MPRSMDFSGSLAELDVLLRELCPIYAYMDLRVESLGETLACSVPLTRATSNHLGGMHASVQWGMAEMLGGLAYFAHPRWADCQVVVRDVEIRFLSVARSDLRAETVFDAAAVADVDKQLASSGRAAFELDIHLRDVEGSVVTTAVGRYRILRSV